MATVSLPGTGNAAAMESLPLELLGVILGYLFEAQALGSVIALARCGRSFSGRVLSLMYDNISHKCQRAGEEALIWAIENNELGLLRTLLDRGVDANARFHSALPDSVRRDVLAAQGLHRRLAPRVDSHLVEKLVQERVVWAEKCRPDQPLELGDRLFRHTQLVRLFLDRGDSYFDVGRNYLSRPASYPGSTAFHSAALRGDVAACELLLAHHTATEGSDGNARLLEQQDGKGLRPLDWAVAAGHVRTTGRWLLGQGVDSLQHISLNDRAVFAPLNLLCSQGRYRDAEYLLGLITCKPTELNLALQMCFARMWKLPRPYTSVLCSLSHLLEEYMEGVVSRSPPVLRTDGEEALLSLVKQLLAAGADPNALLDLDLEDFDVPDILEDLQDMSALHMAASQGQVAAVKILVAAGGQLELRAAHPEDTTPETEPTPMAMVERYSITPTDLPPTLLRDLSPTDPRNIGRFSSPELVEWMLDFLPDTAAGVLDYQPVEGPDGEVLPHPAVNFAQHGFLRQAAVLVLLEHRLLGDQPAASGIEGDPAQLARDGRYEEIILCACQLSDNEGAIELIEAVMECTAHSQGGLSDGSLAPAGWVVSNERPGAIAVDDYNSETAKTILKLLLKRPFPLYGCRFRPPWECPPLARGPWNDERNIHPYLYPAAVAVEIGRADLLELMFRHTVSLPPREDSATELLFMALDTTAHEPNPAIVRAILDHHHNLDLNATFDRTNCVSQNEVTGHLTPLYYLLKTFYKAHVVPKTPPTPPEKPRPIHTCNCRLITRASFLTDTIALLVSRGASWTQQCLPQGESARDVLWEILDAEGVAVTRG
ncbi:hypothetical protein N0V88_006975 [Collariella sp. IMI 366227]|nr:hypothetical protein N0V88_006975 [Collariella sp. IMI 366227]